MCQTRKEKKEKKKGEEKKERTQFTQFETFFAKSYRIFESLKHQKHRQEMITRSGSVIRMEENNQRPRDVARTLATKERIGEYWEKREKKHHCYD